MRSGQFLYNPVHQPQRSHRDPLPPLNCRIAKTTTRPRLVAVPIRRLRASEDRFRVK
jgi:hypothetical protein